MLTHNAHMSVFVSSVMYVVAVYTSILYLIVSFALSHGGFNLLHKLTVLGFKCKAPLIALVAIETCNIGFY